MQYNAISVTAEKVMAPIPIPNFGRTLGPGNQGGLSMEGSGHPRRSGGPKGRGGSD